MLSVRLARILGLECAASASLPTSRTPLPTGLRRFNMEVGVMRLYPTIAFPAPTTRIRQKPIWMATCPHVTTNWNGDRGTPQRCQCGSGMLCVNVGRGLASTVRSTTLRRKKRHSSCLNWERNMTMRGHPRLSSVCGVSYEDVGVRNSA